MAEKNPPSMNQNLTPNQHKQKNNCRDAGNTDVFDVLPLLAPFHYNTE